MTGSRSRRLTAAALALALAAALLAAAGTVLAAPSATYSSTVFSDGFESGALGTWTSPNGTAAVVPEAAHSGGYGLRIANQPGQLDLAIERLAAPLADSSVSFFVRIGAAAGVETVAQARNGDSTETLWALLYDPGQQAFWFFPFRGSSSTGIFTGAGSAPLGAWIKVEVQYAATQDGGARLLLDGNTQDGWTTSGDYTRSSNFQRLQLWNDATGTTDFDDVSVSAPAGAQAPAPPDAPTGVAAVAGDGQVALSWTAPASDGGSPITGYRITPFVGGQPQAPIATGSTATRYTVTGLANGTAYTFTVAAINAVGTGPESAPSAPATPSAPSGGGDGSGGGGTQTYGVPIFSDGFESGLLSGWSNPNSTAAVTADAAHSGNYGVRLANGPGQFDLIAKTLADPLTDSSTSFWMRTSTQSGVQTLAEARDRASSSTMWALLYDGRRQALWFYPFKGGQSTEIFTGAGSVPANTWVEIEVQYTATPNGGARLLIDGRSQPGWAVAGDYTRATNLQRLLLWNDAPGATDFDDVVVAAPGAGQPATAPGAPTALAGTPGDGQVALSWTAPASDGGSPITGYRITPFVGGQPQAPIATGSTATRYTVTGLANGTAYTFTVAAINAVGTGPESAPSAPVTPVKAKTVVSIEFDDGIETQWQALAMLERHNMHATFYVNSGLTTDLITWRLSWPQLLELAAAGNEIGGHTWDHADLTRLTPDEQRHEICDDRTNIQSHGLPLPTSFAYPYGAYEQNGVPAMVQECGYTSGRQVGGIRSALCSTCPYAETIPPANPMVTRTAPDIRIDTTLQTVEGYVTQAEQHGGGWVQIVFHDLCTSDCDIYSTTPALLEAFLDWLEQRAAYGTVVKTVGEVMSGG